MRPSAMTMLLRHPAPRMRGSGVWRVAPRVTCLSRSWGRKPLRPRFPSLAPNLLERADRPLPPARAEERGRLPLEETRAESLTCPPHYNNPSLSSKPLLPSPISVVQRTDGASLCPNSDCLQSVRYLPLARPHNPWYRRSPSARRFIRSSALGSSAIRRSAGSRLVALLIPFCSFFESFGPLRLLVCDPPRAVAESANDIGVETPPLTFGRWLYLPC